MSATQPTTYRIYLRDPSNVLALPFEVNLASDKAAREFALMLDKDLSVRARRFGSARLVCTVRKGE